MLIIRRNRKEKRKAKVSEIDYNVIISMKECRGVYKW